MEQGCCELMYISRAVQIQIFFARYQFWRGSRMAIPHFKACSGTLTQFRYYIVWHKNFRQIPQPNISMFCFSSLDSYKLDIFVSQNIMDWGYLYAYFKWFRSTEFYYLVIKIDRPQIRYPSDPSTSNINNARAHTHTHTHTPTHTCRERERNFWIRVVTVIRLNCEYIIPSNSTYTCTRSFIKRTHNVLNKHRFHISGNRINST
jgi:hypothetical protein